jgi:Tfp pilus assembly protein PilN
MRAVNLIPADARRGGGAGGAGRSGGAAFVLLGGLAVLVALVAAWAVTGRAVSQHKAELTTLTSQVSSLRERLAQRAPSQPQDAGLAQQRLSTVRDLAAARTDWAKTLDAVARTLPAHTSLSGLTASTSPSAAPAGGTGGAPAIASSTTGPSIQLSGCSPSQKAVALLMPRLRIVPGVGHVSLVSATKADAAGGGSPDGCSGVSFQMVLFLEQVAQ